MKEIPPPLMQTLPLGIMYTVMINYSYDQPEICDLQPSYTQAISVLVTFNT